MIICAVYFCPLRFYFFLWAEFYETIIVRINLVIEVTQATASIFNGYVAWLRSVVICLVGYIGFRKERFVLIVLVGLRTGVSVRATRTLTHITIDRFSNTIISSL